MPILKAVKNNQKREFEDEVRTVRKRIDEAKEMKTSDEPEILAAPYSLFIHKKWFTCLVVRMKNINNTMHRI